MICLIKCCGRNEVVPTTPPVLAARVTGRAVSTHPGVRGGGGVELRHGCARTPVVVFLESLLLSKQFRNSGSPSFGGAVSVRIVAREPPNSCLAIGLSAICGFQCIHFLTESNVQSSVDRIRFCSPSSSMGPLGNVPVKGPPISNSGDRQVRVTFSNSPLAYCTSTGLGGT